MSCFIILLERISYQVSKKKKKGDFYLYKTLYVKLYLYKTWVQEEPLSLNKYTVCVTFFFLPSTFLAFPKSAWPTGSFSNSLVQSCYRCLALTLVSVVCLYHATEEGSNLVAMLSALVKIQIAFRIKSKNKKKKKIDMQKVQMLQMVPIKWLISGYSSIGKLNIYKIIWAWI